MLLLSLLRLQRDGKAVKGVMTFSIRDKEYRYNSLENADFIIPQGVYPVEMTWSPKFRKMLPIIEEVPDREGIRIHTGTLPEHSAGCVLVPPEAMYNLKIFFNCVDKFNQFKDENEPEESVGIDIREESGLG